MGLPPKNYSETTARQWRDIERTARAETCCGEVSPVGRLSYTPLLFLACKGLNSLENQFDAEVGVVLARKMHKSGSFSPFSVSKEPMSGRDSASGGGAAMETAQRQRERSFHPALRSLLAFILSLIAGCADLQPAEQDNEGVNQRKAAVSSGDRCAAGCIWSGYAVSIGAQSAEAQCDGQPCACVVDGDVHSSCVAEGAG